MSGDHKLLAYVFPGEDLVVRTITDGKVLRRVPFTLTGSNAFRALSDDGRFPSHRFQLWFGHGRTHALSVSLTPDLFSAWPMASRRWLRLWPVSCRRD